jgi:C1A family cysteine protease
MSGLFDRGTGWRPDLPDFRDFSSESDVVQERLDQIGRARSSRSKRPTKVDLREYLPEPYDQLRVNSATAHACVGLVAYFSRRAHGKLTRPSRLFLYTMTRRLLGLSGNVDTDLRTTLKAMVTFGMPPERYWPYDVTKLDEPPDSCLFSFTGDYRGVSYVRLDVRNGTGEQTLAAVKAFLAAGFPSVFGFPVPVSISQDPDIPYRPTLDAITGGHAVVAVGYDDRRIRTSTGGLLVRNSWGSKWGEDGYGWLPYSYVEEQLAVDFWTLLKPEWIESGEFKRPVL